MSKKSSSSTASQAVSTTNLNVEDGIAATGNSRVTVTDANATNNALKSNTAVTLRTLSTGGEMLDDALDFGGEALDAYYNASGDAFNRVLDFASDNTATVFDTVREAQAASLGAVMDATGQAIDTVAAHARTESEAALNQVGTWIKWAIGGGVLLVAVKAWGKK